MRVSVGAVISVIFALLVGLITIWFFKNFDSVLVERKSGYAREARANDYLAAEKVLQRLGVPTSSTRHFRSLPPLTTTLIVPVSRRQLPETEARRQTRWVRDGGHLVVLAQVDDEQYWKDPLLEPLEVWSSAAPEEGSVAVSYAGLAPDEPPLNGLLTAPAQLHFNPDEWRVVVHSDKAVYGITRALGQGRVSVLSEHKFYTNTYIGDGDHAAILWSIVRAHPHDQVQLLITESVRGLWGRIVDDAWMVLVSTGVLALLLAWSKATRFGPLLPESSTARRRLLDHIQASGRFLWRHKLAGELVATVRASLLRTIEFRHPGWLHSDDLYEKLADIAQLPIESVEKAFAEDNVRNEHVFTQTIQTLENIRKKL